MFLLLLHWHSKMFLFALFCFAIISAYDYSLIESFHCYTFVVIHAPQIIHVMIGHSGIARI